jgi:hypothetical protein
LYPKFFPGKALNSKRKNLPFVTGTLWNGLYGSNRPIIYGATNAGNGVTGRGIIGLIIHLNRLLKKYGAGIITDEPRAI